jgi:hypothetical protein
MVEAQASDENATNTSNSVQSPPTELPVNQTIGTQIYGVAPENTLPGGATNDIQTVEQEFSNYATAKLSARGTDKLIFWKVRGLCLR